MKKLFIVVTIAAMLAFIIFGDWGDTDPETTGGAAEETGEELHDHAEAWVPEKPLNPIVKPTSGFDVTFAEGPEVNRLLKTLANGTEMGKGDKDQLIKAFVKSERPPYEDEEAVIISAEKNPGGNDFELYEDYYGDGLDYIEYNAEIYAWFDASDGTMYWYTGASQVDINDNAGYMFAWMENLKDLSGFEEVTFYSVLEMPAMFAGTAIGDDDTKMMSEWRTFHVKDMSGAFSRTNITDTDPFSEWETSWLENASGLFSYCENLSDISGLAKWDISGVTNMSQMFEGCPLTDLGAIKDWDTGSLSYADQMFAHCVGLSDVSGISSWDVSGVSSTDNMFYLCGSLKEADFSGWDLSALSAANYMFSGCGGLEHIYVGASSSDWRGINGGEGIFADCESLPGWDGVGTGLDRAYAGDGGYFELKQGG